MLVLDWTFWLSVIFVVGYGCFLGFIADWLFYKEPRKLRKGEDHKNWFT
jgi:hypothetical protein